jgi:enolase
MSRIISVKAREVLDSRGNPTVEAEIKVKEGVVRAAVPSGASTGIHEALELRDGGKRFLGKGVSKAVNNVNTKIAKTVKGMEAAKQKEIDAAMIKLDGTKNKSNLGANAILSVSMAATRAAALASGKPLYQHIAKISGNKKLLLPVPSMNVINGGAHAGNKLDVQEYMVLPVGAKNFRDAVQISAEVYQTLKGVIKEKYGKVAINVGDEGGFAPPLSKIEEPLELIWEAVQKAGHEKVVRLGVDAAASEFYSENRTYTVEGQKITAEKLAEKYTQLVEHYPIISMEDVFAQDDWESWKEFTEAMGKKIQIVGDDLLVTNVERIEKAVRVKACNTLLLKINQIGSITESISAAKMATAAGWNVMVSHRSGETEDPYIADLVVGLGTGEIKSGACCRSERNAKYNQLMRIEEELGKKAKYAKMI